MVRLRRFKPSDLMEVVRLSNECLTEAYDTSLYMNLFSNWPEGFIIAERNNRLLGFILGTIEEAKRGRILLFAVTPIARRQGLGSALLRKFTVECLVQGLKAVQLEVRVTNQLAINFYLKRGFRIMRMLDQYYKNGENAYLMYRFI